MMIGLHRGIGNGVGSSRSRRRDDGPAAAQISLVGHETGLLGTPDAARCDIIVGGSDALVLVAADIGTLFDGGATTTGGAAARAGGGEEGVKHDRSGCC